MSDVLDSPLRRFVRAGATTAVCDAIFSSVLVSVFYKSTVTRLWQGVAATVLGQASFDGGTRTMLIGLAMHVCVAFTWSAVFLAIVMGSSAVRRNLSRPGGMLTTAIAYGPIIWLVMSFVVIPAATHRPPTINFRWWVQFFGHIPAVAVPIVWTIAGGLRRERVDGTTVAVPAIG